jgi:hypothetical protein
MLHPRIGTNDEVTAQPGPYKQRQRREPVTSLADRLLSEQQQIEKAGFEKKSEHPFHGKRLTYDATENSEKRDQLVPNWNSTGMPVMTPTTKTTPKIFVQNRTASLAASLPRTALVFRMKMSSANPWSPAGIDKDR